MKILCSVPECSFYVCYISRLFLFIFFVCFFGHWIELGSKLTLKRAQFRIWLSELSQVSTCYALSPKLEQHTQFICEDQLNLRCITRWVGKVVVGIRGFSNIQVWLSRPAYYKKTEQ